MKTDEKRLIEQLLFHVGEWYEYILRPTNRVTHVEVLEDNYELVTYNYKELFELCNYMHALEGYDCYNSHFLQRFFFHLEGEVITSRHTNVNYVDALERAVMRAAIKAIPNH